MSLKMVEKLSILNCEGNTDWLNSNNATEQLLCLKSIRRKLSLKNPDIESVLKLNILPRILDLMMTREDCEFQTECAWILTNIASGKFFDSLYILVPTWFQLIKMSFEIFKVAKVVKRTRFYTRHPFSSKVQQIKGTN